MEEFGGDERYFRERRQTFRVLVDNTEADEIGVFTGKALLQLQEGPPTKRVLLRGLAQICDPLGILGWDDPLPDDDRLQYEEFIQLLERSSTVKQGPLAHYSVTGRGV